MDRNIKTLEDKLIIEKDLLKRIDLLTTLSWELRRTDKIRSLNLCIEANALAIENNYEKGIADSLLCIAVNDSYEGSNVDALEKAIKAYDMFEQLGITDGKIKALNCIGFTYSILGRRDKSLESYLKGLSIAKDTNNKDMLIFLLNNVGEIYKVMNQYDEALKYYFEAYEYCEEGNNSSYGFILNSIGTTYYKMSNLEKAKEYCEKGLLYAQKFKDKITEAHCFKNLGLIYSKLGNYNKTTENLNNSLVIHAQNKNIYGQCEVYYQMGTFYFEYSEYDKAIECFKSSINYAKKSDAELVLADTYNIMAIIYERISDYKRSLECFKAYIKSKERIESLEQEKKLNSVLMDSRLQQAEKDMEIFRLKNVELKEKSEDIERKAKLLEESYKNFAVISEIGQKITSSLDIEKIMNTIYENMNTLMDATVFGIGIYDELNGLVDYRMFIENSKRVPRFSASIDNDKSIAAKCILSKKEIVLLDMAYEESSYFLANSEEEDRPPRSLIYYPLMIENKVIGTITVQSYNPNSYTEHHLDTLKVLGSYIAIALNNSQKSEELKKTAVELQNTLKNLQEAQEHLVSSEKMVALGQLISGIAHEINTPLGAIQASIGNISEYMEHTIGDSVPKLFNLLDSKLQNDFFRMLHISMTKDVTLSSRDERKFKKEVSSYLENQSIANYDSIADSLVDMGIYNSLDSFMGLFIHKESQFIIQTCYELSGIFRNIKNMDLAVGKASKMLYALKSYSHYNHIETPIEIDITEGIDTILALYHNNLKHGTELIKNYSAIPKIKCLPDELNQVWTNLIHNALQAMDYTGTLQIDTYLEGRFIAVKITDSGMGIPDEIKDKIYDPFFTTKRQGEGSGLGLGIVQKIVNKHKGEIIVDSVPGKTSFIVKLPIDLDI